VLPTLVFLLIGCAAAFLYGPVSRARVRRFAERQQLPITATNGHLVIAYLATTRRWRTVGLLVGLAAFNTWALVHNGLGLNSTALLAGWFVGALIAEARVLHLAPAGPRQASLQPRRLPAYLGPISRWVLPAAVGLTTAGMLIAVAFAIRRGESVVLVLAWWIAALVIAGVVWYTQLRVLRRPQPLAEPDVIAADDAVRSRSLHVLAGSGATLVLYCCIAQLGWVWLSVGVPDGRAIIAGEAVATLLIPLLGYGIATASWRVRRDLGVA